MQLLLLSHVLWIVRRSDWTTYVCAPVMAEIEVGLVAEENARPLVRCPVQILVGKGETTLQVEFRQLMLCLLHSAE